MCFLLLAGCSGAQSALDPRGPAASRIAELWWIMFGLGTVVFLVVVGLLLYALRRRDEASRLSEEGARRLVTVGGVAVPLAVLLVLVAYSVRVGGAVSVARNPPEMTVEVVGHQFWWEIRYPEAGVVTANELHLPVGRRVLLKLASADVIHSMWIPALHGKMDMIPGRTNSLVVLADEAGVFRGQCAEFCGTQHAQMSLVVVAQPEAEFAEWLDRQREPAPEPVTPERMRGREVFHSSACVYCHTVRGTNASSPLGPDLTHIASRRTLAAGSIPNNRGSLAAWIVDPQSIKPGNKMPPTDLTGPELQALLDYLESLR